MDGPLYMKFCKDSRLVTRKGDLRHDFPELACRKVFNDTQMEEEEEGSIDAGGGADEMIYMEFLEALGGEFGGERARVGGEGRSEREQLLVARFPRAARAHSRCSRC